MTEESLQKLQKFFRTFNPSATALLLLDYDGTLAGFRVDRFQARPWAGVLELLVRIQQQGNTRIAVITGRPAAEISQMLVLNPPVEVWGLHGAERLYPDGHREMEQQSPAVRAALEDIRRQLRQDAFGGLFEDKPNAAVMHWRGKSPELAQEIEQRTRALFEPHVQQGGLRLLQFEAGLELRAGRDKGGAVRAILQESNPSAPVTYLGDDLTDEAAFDAVNNADGPHLSVLMRHKQRPTCADIWLKPPADMRTFLSMWLEARA